MRAFERGRNSQSGQTLALLLVLVCILILAALLLFDLQSVIRGKLKADIATQAGALAAANWQLHTLYADIATTNTASVSLFGKAGYKECGRFKEWLVVDGKYMDAIRMQLIL